MIDSAFRGDNTASQLRAARNGCRVAFESIVHRYYHYLIAVAHHGLAPRIAAKIAAVDIVQDTLFEAARDIGRFRGTTEQELKSWLRKILHNNVANTNRRFCQTMCRQVGREVSLSQESRFSDYSGCSVSNPLVRLIQREELSALASAIRALPKAQRAVVLLRCDANLGFAQIGMRLGRSAAACRQLWSRAIARLREQIG